MKDSGIEWVGEIPEHWECKPIRALFIENNNKNYLGKETRALQFKFGEIVPKQNFSAEGDEYVAETILKYNIVDQGMIVINGLNLNFDFVTKRVGLVHDRGIITSAYMSFSVKDSQVVIPEYACYLLKSYDNCAAFHNMGGGVRKILNFDELKHNLFVLPPLAEQKAIAEFLDKKCAEVDALIADIQQEIETLEQYKRSVITEAVTKGLDSSAPMKDSKIEWVGEIPDYWEVHPIYYYFGERKHKNSLGKESNLLSLSYGKVIRKDIMATEGLLPENYNGYNIVEKNDIVLRLTDLQNDRRSLRTGLVLERGILTSAYVTLCPIKEGISSYFHYLLHAYDIMKVFYNMGNGVRQGLNFDELSKCVLIAPPLEEQQQIADYLDKKCREIEEIIADKRSQIEMLESYKKSLIYEYVTGKKEVG